MAKRRPAAPLADIDIDQFRKSLRPAQRRAFGQLVRALVEYIAREAAAEAARQSIEEVSRLYQSALEAMRLEDKRFSDVYRREYEHLAAAAAPRLTRRDARILKLRFEDGLSPKAIRKLIRGEFPASDATIRKVISRWLLAHPWLRDHSPKL
jgi:hypothetical protein